MRLLKLALRLSSGVLVSALIVGTALIRQDDAWAQPAASTAMPADGGQSLFEKACSECHALSIVTEQQKSRESWKASIDKMKGLGMSLSDDDSRIVLDYLATYYPVTG